MFIYNCPHCDKEMEGSFGDDVYCEDCDITFETDWDYITEDSPAGWLTGLEQDGDYPINN
jgi:hypothetical protein